MAGFQAWCVVCRDSPSGSPLLGLGDLDACRADRGGLVGIWYHLPPEQPPGIRGVFRGICGSSWQAVALSSGTGLLQNIPWDRSVGGCRWLMLGELSAVVLSDLSMTEATCSSSPTFCFLPRRWEHLKCHMSTCSLPQILIIDKRRSPS